MSPEIKNLFHSFREVASGFREIVCYASDLRTKKRAIGAKTTLHSFIIATDKVNHRRNIRLKTV